MLTRACANTSGCSTHSCLSCLRCVMGYQVCSLSSPDDHTRPFACTPWCLTNLSQATLLDCFACKPVADSQHQRSDCIVQSLIKPNKESFDWSLFDHDIILSDKGERLGMTQEGVDSAAYIARTRKYVWMASGVFFLLVQVVWPLLSLPAGAVWSRPYFK